MDTFRRHPGAFAEMPSLSGRLPGDWNWNWYLDVDRHLPSDVPSDVVYRVAFVSGSQSCSESWAPLHCAIDGIAWN
jgi:hypothetical protein